MKNILVLEDIIQVTNEIKSKLQEHNISIFNSCFDFLNHFNRQNRFSEIALIDIFFIDFNLGDNTVYRSGIYKLILEHKSEKSKICCISSLKKEYVEAICGPTSKSFNRTSSFDFFLPKEADVIKEFVNNIGQN